MPKITVMRRIEFISILIIIIYISNIFLIANREQASDSKELQLKYNKILEKRDLPRNITRIYRHSFFPDDALEKKDIFLVQPIDMCMDNTKKIYILDYKNHSVFKFSEKGEFFIKIGGYGQGPGELIFPSNIFNDNFGTIFVVDQGNGRINKYNNNGKYISSFKFFKSYFSYLVDKEGKLIYANNLRDNLVENSLIDMLTPEGEVINSFGKGKLFNHNSNNHNKVHLLKDNDNNIYAIWQFFNILRKYSPKGILIKEFKISSKLFDEISMLNEKNMILKDRQIIGVKLFSGVSINGDKLYFLRTAPRIEIYECSMYGNVERVYWNDDEKPYTAIKLLIYSELDNIYFIVLKVGPEIRAEVYSTNKLNHH